MRHILTILLITLISLGVSAQSSGAFDYHHFLVDGKDHYQVIAEDASSFGFYSQKDGGKLMQLSMVDGETNTFNDFSNKPAFVICLDEQKREKIYGRVEFTMPALFHLANLKIESNGDKNIIKWSLELQLADDLYVEVQKKTVSGLFETIERISVNPDVQNYEFIEDGTMEFSEYRLLLKSHSSTVYYFTESLKPDNDLWTIFPVPATEKITIESIPENSKYAIIDMKGAIISNGILAPFNDEIKLDGLAPGNYLIQFQTSNSTKTRKLSIQ